MIVNIATRRSSLIRVVLAGSPDLSGRAEPPRGASAGLGQALARHRFASEAIALSKQRI
jgi:hypothetical protein